jgi:Zn-dependent peptidase ImmA (M78 family)
MMETLKLSPEILEWAADQSGSTLGEIARKISNKRAAIIERGELTTAQAVKFSKFAGVPFGYLFLDNPPDQRKLPLADFRTLIEPVPLSKDFYAIFDDIEFKQSWYRTYLQAEQAATLNFVGRFAKKQADAATIAKDIRETLGITDDEIQMQKNADGLYNLMISKAEAIGILVFKNGIVGNNTRRALSVQEFRGFVISDEYVPAIFINGVDAPAAWVFTLAHELAHIWLGESGISDTSPSSEDKHERLCNAIAAEMLIPTERFLALWDSVDGDEDRKVNFIREHIKVSTFVVARRALEMGRVSRDYYDRRYRVVYAAAKNKDKSGGNFYNTFPLRNSRKFTEFVTSLAVRGKISFREAGNLLNTNPNNVMTFHAQQ